MAARKRNKQPEPAQEIDEAPDTLQEPDLDPVAEPVAEQPKRKRNLTQEALELQFGKERAAKMCGG